MWNKYNRLWPYSLDNLRKRNILHGEITQQEFRNKLIVIKGQLKLILSMLDGKITQHN